MKFISTKEGFRFTFQGNKDFEPSRVQILEEMVNRQIHAILRSDIFYTKDVFVPAKAPQESIEFDNSDELRLASALSAKCKAAGFFSSVMEEIEEDNHVCVIATLHKEDNFVNFTIRMDNRDISCDENGIAIGINEVASKYETFYKAYKFVCRMVDGLSKKYVHGE